VIEGFIPPAFCKWIIGRAKPKLEAVRVKDPERGAERADYRSNSGAGFSLLESDLVLQLVNARVAAAASLPLANQEPTNVLHYLPGEEYRPHHDFITRSPNNEAELNACGQRAVTALVYLNDDYEGGETDFPQLDWRYRGRRGDLLLFWNLTPAGEPEPRTLHAGLPPVSGEKWLYSKWIRQKPYPLL
jgi:predicted 2-oxoglutarate/Fe(II)-dependent dioxygenase YbiX